MIDKAIYIICAGGGSQAVSNILAGGGASEYFIGAEMPYNQLATQEVVGGEIWDKKMVSARTAHQMAATAYYKAVKFGDKPPVGIGTTASLYKGDKERPERVNHIFLAVVYSDECAYTIHHTFLEHEKNRAYQEMVCAKLIADAVTRINTGIGFHMLPVLYNMTTYYVVNTIKMSMYNSSKVVPIYPGSFNPVHSGHKHIWNDIYTKFKVPPILDIGLDHMFKPGISPFEYEFRREAIQQSGWFPSQLLSISPSHHIFMVDKWAYYQEMFPNKDILMVMGADTYDRISPKHRDTIKAIVYDREGYPTPDHPNAVTHRCASTVSSTKLRNAI